MILSRRSFFSGLAVALAAPAIVKAEGLMRLAPTEILRPESLITRLDILYGTMNVRPEWEYIAADIPPQLTLDEFHSRIFAPMIEQMQKKVAEAVMFGQGASRYDLHGMKSIGLQDLLLKARSTPSIE